MSRVRGKGPNGLTLSIDDLPQTSRAYELILFHSHAMARSIASWFQNLRILDGTRGTQLEAKIDEIHDVIRARIGAR